MNTIKSLLWNALGAIVLIAFFVALGFAYTAAEKISPDFRQGPGYGPTPRAQTR